jgi:hypothetical protein
MCVGILVWGGSRTINPDGVVEMNWPKIDPYHVASPCGRFTISRANVCGKPVYTAWRRGEPPVALLTVRTEGTEDKRRAAIAACKEACVTTTPEAK